MKRESNGEKRPRPKGKKIIITGVILLVFMLMLYTVAGFFLVPAVARNMMIKKIGQQTHRPVSVEKVLFNPFTFCLTVEGFALKNSQNSNDFVSFKTLLIDAEAASIVKKALVVKSVSITAPVVNLVHESDNRFNFDDLLKERQKPADVKTSQAATPFLFSVNNIKVIKGQIRFDDKPKSKIHRIDDLNLAVPTVSNLPYAVEGYVYPSFSAVVNGTRISVGGKAKPFAKTIETTLDIKLTGLNLPSYLAYVQNPTKMRLKSGRLDVNTRLIHQNRPGSPYLSVSGEVIVSDLNLSDADDKSYIRLPRTTFKLAKANLLAREIHLAAIDMKAPQLELVREKDGRLLPVELLSATPSKTTSTDPINPTASTDSTAPTTPLHLTIDKISLTKGEVRFADNTVESFIILLSPIDITVENISTKTGSKSRYDLALQSDLSKAVKFTGELQLKPFGVTGRGSVEGVRLKRLAPYLKPFLAAQVVDGNCGLNAAYVYGGKEAGSDLRLENVGLNLSGLVLKSADGARQILSLPQLSIADTHLDLKQKILTVGALQSAGAVCLVKRQKDGRIDLADFGVAPPDDTKSAPESKPDPPRTAETAASWQVVLVKSRIKNYGLRFEDRSTTPMTVTAIDDLALNLDDISTTKDSIGSLSFGMRLNDTGRIAGSGRLGIRPLSLKLATELDEIGLKSFQGYIAQHVNLVLTDGRLSAKGSLDLNAKDDRLALVFAGDGALNDFKTKDIRLGEDLLKVKTLLLNNIRFSSIPAAVAVDKIGLDDVYTRLVVAENGDMNLAGLIKKKPPAAEPVVAEKQKEAPARIDLKQITIKNGQLDFSDRQIKPAYAAVLDKIDANVTGLSSKAETDAGVDLSGVLDGQAPLKITGRVNPFRENLFADLKLNFKNIGLSPVSPYSGKYIGYKIGKGKLNLNMHYKINGKKLSAQNNAQLDQLVLGETVKSPSAANLPIRMAIALLKNRKGEIFLNVPVDGDLSDPKFSLGGMILKVIGNLIAKAATSPLALLGKLIPEGVDMQRVGFEPGRAHISATAADQLEKIAGIFYERPGLRMDLIGGINRLKDRTALAKIKLNNLVALEMQIEMQKDADSKKSPKATLEGGKTMGQRQYERYLVQAYAKARGIDLSTSTQTGKKSTAAANKTKPFPSRTEMEQYLLSGIKITDDDLRLLAIQRANKVSEFLIKTGKVEAERIFVVEPQIAPPEKGDSKSDTAQVKMVIK